MEGSTVTLQCSNQSLSTLRQLTWEMNGVNLFAFSPERPLHISARAASLEINMSLTERQLYALVIRRAQRSDAGNYTCVTATSTGIWEQKWELLVIGVLICLNPYIHILHPITVWNGSISDGPLVPQHCISHLSLLCSAKSRCATLSLRGITCRCATQATEQ